MFRLPRFLQRPRSEAAAASGPAPAAREAPVAVSSSTSSPASGASPALASGEAVTRAQTLLGEGRDPEARAVLEALLSAEPGHARALNLLGAIALRGGDAAGAAALFERAMAADARLASARYNLGNALAELGRFEQALTAFEAALAIEPQHADALCNRGLVLQQLQRLDEAARSFEQALALRPDDAELHASLAEVCVALGRPGEAVRHFERATAIGPQPALLHHAHGVALVALGRHAQALAAFDRAIALQPDFPEALSNRGNALKSLGRLDEALASQDRALALQPGLAAIHVNRAHVLRELDRQTDALAACDQAIARDPGLADAHGARGLVLERMGRFEAALESQDRALSLRPGDAKVRFNRALLLLLQGDYPRGWAEYEARWQDDPAALAPRRYPQPLWLGQAPLQGRTILLHAEQGLGDTLQSCRYVEPVARLGARVILEVQRPLADLLRCLPGVAQLIVQGQPVPPVDWQCPLMSLPLAFRSTLDTIPAAAGYLKADPSRVAAWNERLGARRGPRVGLVWSGSTSQGNDPSRNLPLSQLLAQLPPGPTYVSLQKDVPPADRGALAASPQIRDVSAGLTDFAETAALCECLDRVISVDTSVAHLAGALGRPLWVLLPAVPAFRWLLEREDSPWYQGARLYRQGPERRWEPVLARLAADLAALPRS
ncbi:MAG: tetratricopeptide repeat protein [Betaproteobacteria bacterium]|nr:tetratricopeptide repeat protein [Betaproteobacteria bacterium]